MKTTIIKERLQSALIAILFISVFLPFGLNHFGWIRWALLGGIGIIIALCVLTSEFVVDKLFDMPNDITRGSKYIIKRNIRFESINILMSVALMSLFLDAFANNDIVDNHFGWQTIGYVFAINCFTTIVIHVYWRSVYKKRYLIKQLEEAQLLNGMLQERQRHNTKEQSTAQPTPIADNDDVICISGATKESLEVRPSEVLFATSEGNYVRVHYIKDGNVQNMSIRTSMKNVADLLCRHSYIMQCHRAFIVNLRHVEKVESRNSGIALVMQYGEESVLVSKQYAAEVKERIKNPVTVA
ncbi:MAG: LytR/AlgR family response regulator transcription factor [Prevotella sp.]